MSETFLTLRQCEATPFRSVPVLSLSEFRDAILGAAENGRRLVALCGTPLAETPKSVRLIAVLADDMSALLELCAADIDEGGAYRSLTPDFPQAHWFEREIAEIWGVRPEGHPWLKPIRFHRSIRPGVDAWNRDAETPVLPGVTDYFVMEGRDVHEVAVGPVHAGVIEPGHFRFQCHGEDVYNLEISLGYQHRGIENHLIGGPNLKTPHYMETAAGDTSIGHMTAYCQAYEALSDARAPFRSQALRAIALELERLANHVGDLGALANDIAFLPTASYCGRLRGEYLNMTALLCGNRFGRSFMVPGGVRFDLGPERREKLLPWLRQVFRDTEGAISPLWTTPSTVARFEDTGAVSVEDCENLGLVGVAARACGVERDVRFDFPHGIYRANQIPVATCHTGDVLARAFTRWMEIDRSVEFIENLAAETPDGLISAPTPPLDANKIVVSLAEGWRGEICHMAVTDDKGKFAFYKIVDPSFHNWAGLAMALRNERVYNFPICNKSFNLSYCGHDL